MVLGRKAWLFSDTTDGVNASMAVFSMVETAKANGLDPQKYLQYLLDKRPNSNMTDEELEQFLPWSSEAKEACGCSNIPGFGRIHKEQCGLLL